MAVTPASQELQASEGKGVALTAAGGNIGVSGGSE